MDRQKGMLSLILAVILSLGMKLSLLKQVTERNSPDVDLNDMHMVLSRLMYRSLPTAKMPLLLTIVAITVLIYVGLSVKITGKDRFLYLLVAVLFSATQLIAFALKHTGQWEVLYFLPIQRLRTGIRGICLLIVAYYILKVFIVLADHLLCQKDIEERRNNIATVVLIAALIFLAWLPYYFIFYPGTSNEDTVIMIMEYFHVPSYILKLTPVQGENIFLTDHHPYLLILLFGRFIQLGLDMGDVRKGVAIYSLLQMLLLSGIFASAIAYLNHVGVARGRVIAVLLLIMFFPIFPMYAICMLKDTIYAALCLPFILMLHEIFHTRGDVLRDPRFLVGMAVDGMLMMLTKKYAVYLLVIIGVVIIINYKLHWKQILCAFAVPILVFQVGYIHLLLPANSVAPGGVQEGLSVPFMQTARYITEYPDEVTEEEKEVIDRIIPYKYWTKCYRPKLSDDLKEKYRQTATEEDLKAYFKIWFAMFLKHPGVYFEATFHNTYEYYDVDKISSLVYYEWNTYLSDHPRRYADAAYLIVSHDEETRAKRYVVNQIVLALEKVPILNIFAAVGLLPWLIIFAFLMNKRRGKPVASLPWLLPWLTFLVCLTSPDNGNYRYIMPTMFALPFLLVLLFLPKGKSRL